MDFITVTNDPAFWVWAAGFMVLGILIGWFFTRRGWRRRLNEAETRIADMETAQRRARREQEEQGDAAEQVSQLTAQVEQLQASLQSADEELTALRAQAPEAAAGSSPDGEPEAERIEDADQEAGDGAELPAEAIAARTAQAVDEESDLRMQLSLLQEEFDAAAQNAAAELERARTDAEMLAAAQAALEDELAATRAEAEAAREEAEALRAQVEEAGSGSKNKEIALNEAYEHAAAVQSQLKTCQEEVSAARNSVKQMQAEVAALEKQKEELEQRVQHSRSDVAGDLAVLTSTMLKIKDDALDDANERIAELTEEIEQLRERLG